MALRYNMYLFMLRDPIFLWTNRILVIVNAHYAAYYARESIGFSMASLPASIVYLLMSINSTNL